MRYYFYSLLSIIMLCQCDNDTRNYLSISNEVLSFRWNDTTKEIWIDTEDIWSVSSDIPSWINLHPNMGNGDTPISVEVSQNKTGGQRSASISISTQAITTQLVILQDPQERLSFTKEKWKELAATDTTLSITIDSNISYQTKILPEEAGNWISAHRSNNINDDTLEGTEITTILNNQGITGDRYLRLDVSENRQPEERYAQIIIYNTQYELTDTLHITQAGTDGIYHYDTEVIQLQKATCGNVNLIIMGDGFVQSDLTAGGKYESAIKQAAEHFFSIEPFLSHRNYFNVYMVVAESEEAGVNNKNSWSKIKNKFDTTFGNGTEITCNDDLVFEYAYLAKELPENKPLLAIVVLNSTKYAGTTYLYSDGNSIALCPMSTEKAPNDFEGLIHHEACGHGFGFLCDEYVYYQQTIPSTRIMEIKEWQKLGYQMNLDFTNDTSAILWKDFIGTDKYEMVGAYEGGFEYQYGVWRPEENSCMNNNIPYFNAQSRWCITKRIMELSDIQYNIQKFMENDQIPPIARTKSVFSPDSKPLGSPILIRR